MGKSSAGIFLIAGIVLLPVLTAISVFAGSSGLIVIIRDIRLPRTLAALLCGSALSTAGLLLQSALNNSLASPGIIGVNSGAGLFTLIAALLVPYSSIFRTLFALGGALIAVTAVYLISAKTDISRTSLILAGVAVSSCTGALIDVIITLHPEIVAEKVAFALGGFSGTTMYMVRIVFPVILMALCVAVLLAPGIDLFPLGDENAFSLGLNVRVHRILTVITVAFLAGSAVSLCGLLGFVGLIIPNLIRLVSNGRTRTNIFLCAVWGGLFLMLCDLLARTVFFPYEVPAGLFLSCLGSPFFIIMLIRRRRRLDP